jgi:hypothetical protein
MSVNDCGTDVARIGRLRAEDVIHVGAPASADGHPPARFPPNQRL